jgi:dipeptidyl aminopeptidase/acylaminoacyl peptidase
MDFSSKETAGLQRRKMRLYMRSSSLRVLLVLGSIVGGAVNTDPATAQGPSGLPPEEVIRMQQLRGGLRDFSPDGQWFAFVVGVRPPASTRGNAKDVFARTGLAADGIGSDIAIVNMRSRESRNLTVGKGDSWLPAWSPDGRYLAFISTRDSGKAGLWVWDAKEDRLKKISGAAIRMGAPQRIGWTPDSRKLLVTTAPGAVSVAEHAERIELSERRQERAATAAVTLYRGTAAARNAPAIIKSDPWDLEDASRDLVLVDIADGKSLTIAHNKRIACFHIFRDGSRVAYSTMEKFAEAGSQQILYNLAVVALPGGQETIVASGIRLDLAGEFSASPDGSQLSYRADAPAGGGYDVYVAGIDDLTVRNLTHLESSAHREAASPMWANSPTPLWDRNSRFVYYVSGGSLWEASVREGSTREVARVDGRRIRDLLASSENRLWTKDGEKSTIVITHNDSEKDDGFYEVELASGRTTKLLEKGQCYTCAPGMLGHLAAATNDGQWLAYTAEDAQQAGEIWLSDAGFRNPSRLTRLNPGLDNHKMGAARLIDWLDDDGERRHGALILPSNHEEGKRSPLVVFVYGGTSPSEKIEMFGGFDRGLPYLNVQLLATRGYAVLLPDAPQHLGTPMLDLAKTVLPGVNRVVEMGIADPERIGVMGHSYGGYSTLSLIAQTKRFKAAVECNGYGDLMAQYGEMAADGTAFGTSIGETGQALMGGTPWQYRARYVENSPISYLDRVETPLLIVHGADDAVVASFLGDEVFVGLRRLGKTVEYAKYQGEGHVISGYANQLDVANRLILWFDMYLKSESH